MNTKKLTESALLSALFIVFNIMAVYTGIAYFFYFDLIVPLFVCLIFIRLGKKYTMYSAVTSLLITILSIGDVPSAIWMTQGMLLGYFCGYFIVKKSSIFDDILYVGIAGCFVMVLIDLYLTALTGYSVMAEFEEYKPAIVALCDSINAINGTTVDVESIINTALYISIASVPISTIVIIYVASLFIGSRLNMLSPNTGEKYLIIKNYKRYGALLCLSRKTFLYASIYLVTIEMLKLFNINILFSYLNIVAMSARIIVIFFVLKDSFGFLMRALSLKVQSKELLMVVWFMTIYMILTNFKVTFVILFVTSFIINYFSDIRGKQINVLERSLLKR